MAGPITNRLGARFPQNSNMLEMKKINFCLNFDGIGRILNANFAFYVGFFV
jgi:hypothetical protein